MKQKEIQFWKKEMLSHYDTLKDLKADLERHFYTEDDSLKGFYYAKTIKYFIDGGCFTVSNYDVLDLFKKLYGKEYKEDKYLRKNGELRYRDDSPVIWIVYKDKMAFAISKLLG